MAIEEVWSPARAGSAGEQAGEPREGVPLTDIMEESSSNDDGSGNSFSCPESAMRRVAQRRDNSRQTTLPLPLAQAQRRGRVRWAALKRLGTGASEYVGQRKIHSSLRR
mgnify:CR=1 FL=1